MDGKRIMVEQGGGVSLYAYGQGAHLMASFVCATEEDGRRLREAIEALVEYHIKPAGGANEAR